MIGEHMIRVVLGAILSRSKGFKEGGLVPLTPENSDIIKLHLAMQSVHDISLVLHVPLRDVTDTVLRYRRENSNA